MGEVVWGRNQKASGNVTKKDIPYYRRKIGMVFGLSPDSDTECI